MIRERRLSPRIEILGELQGHAIVLDEPVDILTMSTGGLTIVTRSPLIIGSVHAFRLTRESESLVLTGRVVHRRGWFVGDETRYMSGVQFVEVSQEMSAWLQKFTNSLQVADSHT